MTARATFATNALSFRLPGPFTSNDWDELIPDREELLDVRLADHGHENTAASDQSAPPCHVPGAAESCVLMGGTTSCPRLR